MSLVIFYKNTHIYIINIIRYIRVIVLELFSVQNFNLFCLCLFITRYRVYITVL